MTAATAPTALPTRRPVSAARAMLLAVAGNMLVFLLGALLVAGVGVAAIVVFGPGILAAV